MEETEEQSLNNPLLMSSTDPGTNTNSNTEDDSTYSELRSPARRGTTEPSSWRPPTPPPPDDNQGRSLLSRVVPWNTSTGEQEQHADESLLLTEEGKDGGYRNLVGNVVSSQNIVVPNTKKKGVYHPPNNPNDPPHNPNIADASEQVRSECPLFFTGADDVEHKLTTSHSLSAFQTLFDNNNGAAPPQPSLKHNSNEYEQVVGGTSPRRGINASIHKSSLYHTTTNTGSVQIRLPADNVRLVMDPNLEPGILSIVVDEQAADARHNSPSITTNHLFGDDNGNTDNAALQPLKYALTVDSNLYKRVISEASTSYVLPCGLYECCHDVGGGRFVSIWVALVILAVVFVCLFIPTMIWPTN